MCSCYSVELTPFRCAGPDTIEGDLSEEELRKNRRDQTIDNAQNRYTDDPYYASREYKKSDIVVPMLSVANWVRDCTIRCVVLA